MARRRLERILLVEDEKDIQIVSRLALEDLGGFQVLVCSSGQEALLQAPAFEPDLILLDVLMPDLDGLTTLELLRRLPGFDGIPVIFVTARGRSQDIAEYRSAGAVDVILKPFDPLTLADQLRGVWERLG